MLISIRSRKLNNYDIIYICIRYNVVQYSIVDIDLQIIYYIQDKVLIAFYLLYQANTHSSQIYLYFPRCVALPKIVNYHKTY